MWGPGGYPPHPYLQDPGPLFVGADRDAAIQAQQAATVLGQEMVDQRLQDAARFGGAQQVQEAAMQAAAEAHWVMSQHQRQAAQAVSARAPTIAPMPQKSQASSSVATSSKPKRLDGVAPTVQANSQPEESLEARISKLEVDLIGILRRQLAIRDRAIRQKDVMIGQLEAEVAYLRSEHQALAAHQGYGSIGEFLDEVDRRSSQMGFLEVFAFTPLTCSIVFVLAVALHIGIGVVILMLAVAVLIAMGIGIYSYWEDYE